MQDRDNTGEISIAARKYAREGNYWLNKLSGQWVKSIFPYDFIKTGPGTQEQRSYEEITFPFPAGWYSRLLKLSKGYDYTLHMIFTAAVTLLLSKYTENPDIIVGTPIYRQENEAEFINTVLAIRSQLNGQMTYKEVLLQVRKNILEAVEYQNYPLKSLLANLDLPVSGSEFPLFEVAVLLDRLHDRKYISHIPLNIIFYFRRSEEDIEGILSYNPSCYTAAAAERIKNHFLKVQEAMIFAVDEQIRELDLLSQEEKEQLLFDFNNTQQAYPPERTILHLFADRVQKNPDALALEYRHQKLTYGELDLKIRQLAIKLQEKGVQTDTIAAMIMERSLEMMVGIMAIIKAGGAYLPIDPDLPPTRIDYMLKDSKVKVLLAAPEVEVKAEVEEKITNIEKLSPPSALTSTSTCQVGGTNLAYIIYTSGSTGLPKAAMIEHYNLHHLIVGLEERIYRHYSEGLKVALVAPYFFDASVKQVFAALGLGHCLSIVPEDTRIDGRRLLEYYAAFCIDVSDGTPTHLRLLLESSMSNKFPFLVRHFVIGGEDLPKKVAEDFFNGYAGSRRAPKITNIYGVTECAVDSTSFEITPENFHDWDTYSHSCPIGNPLPDTTIYILNRQNQLQPVGVPGELCIFGSGVGRGYLNQPELTAEKFLATEGTEIIYNQKFLHSKSAPPDLQRLYKTGDLARWLVDGNIEFLGRRDFQVKIRGYRLELGEIRNRLLTLPGIKDAAVLVNTGKNQDSYLCAYVVPGREGDWSADVLRKHLSRFMPDYMIPVHFVNLDKIPLTPNGKINRKALPPLETVVKGIYTAPRDSIEEQLARTWSELLDIEYEKIGIDANFFQLGGHSLKATIMSARVHKLFNVEIHLIEVFKTPTIRGLSQLIKESHPRIYAPIPLEEEKEYYPLSPAMKRLYIEQQLNPGNVNYNVTISFWLEGHLDRKRLEQIFKKITQRHQTLCTAFVPVQDEPVQKIHHDVDIDCQYFDLTMVKLTPRVPGKDETLEIDEILENFVHAFDLGTAPLLKVGLIKIKETRHVLLVDVHHMVCDGTSVGLIASEFMALYSGEKLPPLPMQYKDYSQWKTGPLYRALREKQEKYWLNCFRQEPTVLNLPLDYPRPAVKSSQGLAIPLSLDIEETQKLKDLALQENVSLYMLLVAIYNVFLSRLSGVEDIVLGTPSAGRNHTSLEPLIGMFVNTLVLRNYPHGNKNFADFLAEVKKTTLEVFENQEYNFEELVQHVVTHRDMSRSPIADVFFALQNMYLPDLYIPGLTMKQYEYKRKVARYDLSFILLEGKTRLWLYVEYCTKLFKEETIHRFIRFFRKIAASVVDNPRQKIKQIRLITEEERHRLLYEFNDTRAAYPADQTIHELFVHQLEKTPDHVVLVGARETHEKHQQYYNMSYMSYTSHLSYKELNEQSNHLACLLKEKGVAPDTIVGIMMERSIEMIIGILAILKAGGAYLPIDPEYPQDRINYMLADSRAKMLVTTQTLSSMSHLSNMSYISTPRSSEAMPPSALTSTCQVSGDSLAYILYTSGTTGRPKGVMIHHQHVIRLVKNSNYIDFSPWDRLLLTGNIVFDITTFEIWWPLLNGLTLLLAHQEVILDAEKLGNFLAKNRISILHLIPGLFNQLVEQRPGIFAGLRYFLVGGDLVRPHYVNLLQNTHKALKILHMYGPTENTTFSTYFPVEKEFKVSIPIGKPIANSTVYILDKYGYLQPIGISGELCVGGDGVARGYLNNPELTAEKFLATDEHGHSRTSFNQKFLLGGPGPHGAGSLKKQGTLPNMPCALPPAPCSHPLAVGDRIYKTGDLARWLPDGNIEFLGRIDQQIKIRGMRIEVEEIENQLVKHEKIKEAVVGVKGQNLDSNDDGYLCAYIVPAGSAVVEDQELREYLSLHLPSYMIPIHFAALERIPLTTNGKLDKKALPDPELKPEQDQTYISPRDALEERLLGLWSGVLNISPIGIDDNFFKLGGHSLKAALLVSRIQRVFRVNLPLVDFFNNPSVRGLANYIRKSGQEKQFVIRPTEKRDRYYLASAQKRLYFLYCINPRDTIYNIPASMWLHGGIDVPLFKEAFKHLVQRHESLRTSFLLVNGEPFQSIHDEVQFEIEYYDSGRQGNREIGNKDFIRPFDLSQAPLLRVRLIKKAENQHIFMVDMHHIVSDGASIQILIDELITLYSSGVKKSLPPLSIYYKDYSHWQNSDIRQEIIKKQENYWLNQFKGEIPVLNLPLDFPRPAEKSNKGAYTRFEIDPGTAEKLRTLAVKEDATMFMVILTLFNILMLKLSGQEDIILGTVTAGRNADLEKIIGMFVNTLVLRNLLKEEKTFSQCLRETRARTLQAFDNQDYQFEDLVEKVLEKRNPTRNPLFDVMFVFGMLDTGNTTPAISTTNLTVKPYKEGKAQAKFDMIFSGIDTGEKLVFSLGYCRELFKEETIARFIKYFKEIVSGVKENESLQLKDISISHDLVIAQSDVYKNQESDFEF